MTTRTKGYIAFTRGSTKGEKGLYGYMITRVGRK